jgi:hypothetical protein
MTKKRLKHIAFAVASAALLIVAWRHGDAAWAIATGALAIIGSLAGINIPTGGF